MLLEEGLLEDLGEEIRHVFCARYEVGVFQIACVPPSSACFVVKATKFPLLTWTESQDDTSSG